LIGAQIAYLQIRGAVRTGACKGQLLSIRREIRLVIIGRVGGEPLESGSVRLDAIEIGGTIALGCEGDPLSILPDDLTLQGANP